MIIAQLVDNKGKDLPLIRLVHILGQDRAEAAVIIVTLHTMTALVSIEPTQVVDLFVCFLASVIVSSFIYMIVCC